MRPGTVGTVSARPKPAPREVTPTLVYAIGRVNQGVRRELQRRLARLALSVAEYTTLSVLLARPGLSNAQLARRALMTPQSMNEVVAALERRGLVVRTVDPAHARILRTELTPRGARLLDEAEPAVAEMQEAMLAGVEPADREVLLRGLLTCMANLSGGLPEPVSRAGRAV